MKTIKLTQGKFAQVDDEDFEYLNKFKWYAQLRFGTWYAGTNTKLGNGKYKSVQMHRLILGITDPKILIDHKYHNGLDNQKKHMRISTRAQNKMNGTAHKGSSSKYLGVSIYRATAKNRNKSDKWKAQIGLSGKMKSLGYFHLESDAAVAYNNAALKYFGEFANLNSILD